MGNQFCPHCGWKLDPSWASCPACGRGQDKVVVIERTAKWIKKLQLTGALLGLAGMGGCTVAMGAESPTVGMFCLLVGIGGWIVVLVAGGLGWWYHG